ncbi:hypothetical protein GCM10009623_20680 [Nocardioides aestuarii]|uniref:ABC transporter substrate-binding protein n=1 Tax=Nocardioides aestuarii TaxID=252231 RepID=A0ABW4TNB9_9ACTN
MSHLRSSRLTALLVSAVLGLALVATAGGFAGTAQAGPAPAAALADPVASSPAGSLTADVTGTTADEDAVTGTFTPLGFSKKNGKVFVRGVVDGVITDTASGDSRTFTVIRKTRVISMNGVPATARSTNARALADCEVLDLVLAPIHLDLLGLVVDLDRVHLNITAVSGPGNLLGNLLCSVVGLLDGGLQGLLGRVVRLLNRILGQLGLGL